MLKIGLIDSGMGGISVLKHLICGGITADYYYLYDNKYHPYGSKSKSELVSIGFANMKKMVEEKVDIVVIACNTLTSTAVRVLRNMFDIPIIGVEPPIKPATALCDNILLLATPATLKSDRVEEMINSNYHKNFYFPDMSDLAYLIETNFDKMQVIRDFLVTNLQKYKDIQAVVLGCTHYNFIADEVSKIFPKASVFTNLDGVVKRTKYIINKNNFRLNNNISVKLFASGKNLQDEKKEFLCEYLNFDIDFLT